MLEHNSKGSRLSAGAILVTMVLGAGSFAVNAIWKIEKETTQNTERIKSIESRQSRTETRIYKALDEIKGDLKYLRRKNDD